MPEQAQLSRPRVVADEVAVRMRYSDVAVRMLPAFRQRDQVVDGPPGRIDQFSADVAASSVTFKHDLSVNSLDNDSALNLGGVVKNPVRGCLWVGAAVRTVLGAKLFLVRGAVAGLYLLFVPRVLCTPNGLSRVFSLSIAGNGRCARLLVVFFAQILSAGKAITARERAGDGRLRLHRKSPLSMSLPGHLHCRGGSLFALDCTS